MKQIRPVPHVLHLLLRESGGTFRCKLERLSGKLGRCMSWLFRQNTLTAPEVILRIDVGDFSLIDHALPYRSRSCKRWIPVWQQVLMPWYALAWSQVPCDTPALTPSKCKSKPRNRLNPTFVNPQPIPTALPSEANVRADRWLQPLVPSIPHRGVCERAEAPDHKARARVAASSQ